MNQEGRALLTKLGFPVPFSETVIPCDEVRRLDLDAIYNGSRWGVSIQVGSANTRMHHGPNDHIGKLSGAHYVPRERFHEEFERVTELALRKGVPRNQQVIAICQSVASESAISAICAKVDERGFGYVVCESMQGQRPSGDFKPELTIEDQVTGGRRMAHTRQIQGESQIPDWARNWMLYIMSSLNRLESGVIGVEFVIDRQFRIPMCYDFYWSPERVTDNLREKFHLTR